MTVVVCAPAPAPAAAPVVARVHAPEKGGHGFSAALDALTAGEGKAKSTDEGDKRTGDDAADAASARPAADLRAALTGGALASLSMPSKAVADAASPVGNPRGTTASSRSDSGPDAAEPNIGEAVVTPAGAKSVLGATVTAERAYIAPAAFANALDGPACDATPAAAARAEAQAQAISAPGATAPGQRGPGTASAPSNAATAAPSGNAASPISAAQTGEPGTAFARANAATVTLPADAASLVSAAETGVSATASAQAAGLAPPGAPPVTPPAATAATFARDQGVTMRAASATSAAAASGASAVEPPPAAATALPRFAPTFVRAAGTAHAAGTGSAGRAAASAGSTAEAKTDAGEAAKPGAAGGQGANAPLQGAPSTNLFGAAAALAVPAQAGAASSTPSTSSAPSAAPAAQTSPSPAAVPAAQRVHEIDLDLAPGGVADASMTVRLAGDKLGVVIRAASGETAARIEGARDAIAERLAAIGQPVSSIIIQQTDASDATGGSGQPTGEGEGRAEQGQNGDPDDGRGSRRGASGF